MASGGGPAQQEYSRLGQALSGCFCGGRSGTNRNQLAFLGDHVLENTLLLAFTQGVELPIRTEALVVIVWRIRGNPRLQERRSDSKCPRPRPVSTSGQWPGSASERRPQGLCHRRPSRHHSGVNSLLAFDPRVYGRLHMSQGDNSTSTPTSGGISHKSHDTDTRWSGRRNYQRAHDTAIQLMPGLAIRCHSRHWFAAVR